MIHLHIHSDKSLLDGYGKIEQYIELAKKNNDKYLALTDHHTMLGIYNHIKLCKKNDIIPICGIEFNMTPYPYKATHKEFISHDSNQKQILMNNGASSHLTVLAKNKQGLFNLFKLLYLSYDEENTFIVPRIDYDLLEEYKEGLIILSGCPNSDLNVFLRLNQQEKAVNFLKDMKNRFGDDFYIEIMDYKTVLNYSWIKLIKLAHNLKIKPVITNDVHYAFQKDSDIHEKVMAIGGKSSIEETPTYKGGLRYALGDNNRYYKNTEEMLEINFIKENPKIAKALFKSIEDITNKIEEFDLEFNPNLRPIIKEFPKGITSNIDYLKHLINQGFQKIRKGTEYEKESIERIKHELEVIISNDFVDYFLVVQDFIKWANNNNIPTGIGRGSAGGSEVSYLIGIHHTDPLKFGLLFERFISPGRGAIYQIEYEDGSIEEIPISDKKTLSNGEEKYIYQLKVGDKIEEN